MATPATPLSALAPGARGAIVRIDPTAPTHARLLELGLTPGAQVEVVRLAPLGDPMEIAVRGCRLSLRKQEASAILISA